LEGETMTKETKNLIVSDLTQEFKASNAIVVCNYKGLTHKELETLRLDAAQNDTKVRVIKNTLASIAIKNAGLEEIELKDTNIFLWSEDQISACKVADKFKNDKFDIKAGIIEGAAADIDRVNAFAKLPSRDELIGMLLSVWTAPARNFVTGLDNLKAKKEEAA
jgi:large subunit ribosomal protein L10